MSARARPPTRTCICGTCGRVDERPVTAEPPPGWLIPERGHTSTCRQCRVMALVNRAVVLWEEGQPHSDGDAAMRLVRDIIAPDADLDEVVRDLVAQEEGR